MKFMIRRKNKQNSLNLPNKMRASFVSLESENTKRFKYKFPLRLSKYKSRKLIALKNTCNKIKGIVRLNLDKFDFIAAGRATMIWLLNSFVEGLIINFVVWGLLGWEFNLITIMAWGVGVRQSLDLYWRLKLNGTNTKLPEKHE